MSESNKDGTDMMMAMLMGLSGPRASRAWTEAQEIQAMSFLTLAEHWINETATEIVRVKEENNRLKAEVERLRYVGDGMAVMVGHIEVTGDAHRMMLELSEEWNAAKEGKPSV